MNKYIYKRDYLNKIIKDLQSNEILNFSIINRINGLLKYDIDITDNQEIDNNIILKLNKILELYKKIYDLLLNKKIENPTESVKDQLNINFSKYGNPLEYNNNKVNILSKIIKNIIEKEQYKLNDIKDYYNERKIHIAFDKSLGL